MAISTMEKVSTCTGGSGGGINPRAITARWTGDALYPNGGSAITSVLRTAAGDNGIEPIACIPADCGVYRPVITETPAVLETGVASWPVADQDTKTLTYKVNGGAEATLTLAGAHTSRAHLAASINSGIAGVLAYDDGTQVTIKTIRTGEDASFQVMGGTANTVYLFDTTAVAGSSTKLLKVFTEANVDAAAAPPATVDLSGTEFNATFLCK